MYLTKETKKEIFKKHGDSETNTGKSEEQELHCLLSESTTPY